MNKLKIKGKTTKPFETTTRGFFLIPFYNIFEISKEEGIIHLLVGEDEYHRIAMGNFLALDQRTRKIRVVPACY
jgi:hypothetical protein